MKPSKIVAEALRHLNVSKAARAQLKQQRPFVLWFTGLSAAGKSTIANIVETELFTLGYHTFLLDGEFVREGLNRDLGFSESDRTENIRRTAEVAKLMVDAGLIVLTAFISPFRADRQTARSLFSEGEFVEIFVDAPLEIAETRDPKGIYKRARRGELKLFTGIDSPYESPLAPDIRLDTTVASPDDTAELVMKYLHSKGLVVLEQKYKAVS
jgi:bifunctional enzyme CysN/CysC